MNKTIITIAVLIIAFTVSGTRAFTFAQEPADCGRPADGIQMCLASSGWDLRLTFSNVGDRDVTLNLGVMLANGKVQLPNNIAIKFTDAQGATRLFKFSDLKHAGVGGRVDDYVVPLRAGSSYSLKMRLDQFWCFETKEFSIPLLPGRNYLTAQFAGTGARSINLDMPGIKLMNFWLGKVESNTLTIQSE